MRRETPFFFFLINYCFLKFEILVCGPRIFCDPELILFFSALLSSYVLQIPFVLIPKSLFFFVECICSFCFHCLVCKHNKETETY